MGWSSKIRPILMSCLWLGMLALVLAEPVSAKDSYQPVTTANPAISADELGWMVKPLNQKELAAEAEGWLALVQNKTRQISDAEIALIRQRKQVEAAKNAEKILKSDSEQQGAETAPKSRQAEKLTEKKEQAKEKTVLSLNELRDQRAALVEKLETVLTELERKGGDPKPHRTYIKAISGIAVDVTDTSSTWLTVVGWLKSDQGGMKWGLNLLKFMVTLFVFWILARITGAATHSIVKSRRFEADGSAKKLHRQYLVSYGNNPRINRSGLGPRHQYRPPCSPSSVPPVLSSPSPCREPSAILPAAS